MGSSDEHTYAPFRPPTKTRGGWNEEDTIAWAVDVLIDHFEKNPRHGTGCACTDIVAWKLRQAVRARRTKAWSFEEPEHIQKAFRSLSAIFQRLGNEH